MVRRLEARVDRLTRLPFLGRPLSHGGLRETIVPYGKSRYVIRYRVTDTTIQIVRIWHGRENRPA
jgi:plasmid stabilization system protein ParE